MILAIYRTMNKYFQEYENGDAKFDPFIIWIWMVSLNAARRLNGGSTWVML